MKFSRTAAVIGAAVVLVGGAAVAVNAATSSDTVSLCVNSSTTTVSAPNRSGNCISGDLVALPSKQAFDALKGRVNGQDTTVGGLLSRLTAAEGKVSTLETTVGQQGVTIDQLTHRLNDIEPATLTATGVLIVASYWRPVLIGHELLPGSKVHWKSASGSGTLDPFPVVDANGDIDTTVDTQNVAFDCNSVPVTFTLPSRRGNTISATVTAVHGC